MFLNETCQLESLGTALFGASAGACQQTMALVQVESIRRTSFEKVEAGKWVT